MNILYVTHSQIPSSSANSIQIMHMCRAFQKKHQVVLLARKPKTLTISAIDVFNYYGLSESFEIVKSGRAKSGTVDSMQNYWLLFKLLKQGKFDLCFGRHLKSLVIAGYLGLPIIYEAHEMPKGSNERFLIRQILGRKNFLGIVCISKLLKRKYQSLFPVLSPDKIMTAHDGISLSYIDKAGGPKSRLKGKDSAFKAGYVGSLKPEKGIDLILRIASLLPDTEFHLVGGKESEVEFWKDKSKSRDNVLFYGQVGPLEAIQYQKAFHVLLAPYQQLIWKKRKDKFTVARDDKKVIGNSPLKYFEYMACRKPIVTSDIDIAREVFAHGENALLLDPEDPVKWSDWIVKLKEDKELSRAISENARKRVEEFTWDKRADKILGSLMLS